MHNALRKQGYREVVWEDDDGRRFTSMLPPGLDDSEARSGLLLGPQAALADLGLALSTELRLHNALHSRRIFTYDDARRAPESVRAALLAALKVDAAAVVESYRFVGVD